MPSKFAGQPPVNPDSRQQKQLMTHEWRGTTGLVNDIKHYGRKLKAIAAKELTNLYPRLEIDSQRIGNRKDLETLKGESAPVFAWIWTRTVKSPNPAYSDVFVPLASTFILSKKCKVSVDCKVDGANYVFHIKEGAIPTEAALGTKAAAKGAAFRCILSNAPISADYIRSEGKKGLLSFKLMAVVCKSKTGKIFLPPLKNDEDVAASAVPSWSPDVKFFPKALGFRIANYGLTDISHLA